VSDPALPLAASPPRRTGPHLERGRALRGVYLPRFPPILSAPRYARAPDGSLVTSARLRWLLALCPADLAGFAAWCAEQDAAGKEREHTFGEEIERAVWRRGQGMRET